MLKKLLLICSVFHTTFLFFGQDDSKAQVNHWKNEHPEVKLINSSEYQKLTENEKIELAAIPDKIIFSDYLLMEDILAFETAENKLTPRSEAEYIFNWEQSHSAVKVIKRSYFNSLTTEKQLMYVNAGSLILMGDKLTKKDILLYEHTH